jgi:hypothetical protein
MKDKDPSDRRNFSLKNYNLKKMDLDITRSNNNNNRIE